MTHHDALPLGVGLFAVWHVAVVLLYFHHRDALRAEGEQRARDREAAQTRAQWYEVAAHLERCRAHFRSLRASLDRPLPGPTPRG